MARGQRTNLAAWPAPSAINSPVDQTAPDDPAAQHR